MDIIDVQKSKPRNLFVKIRRALGNLRNFFGLIIVTPYMLRKNNYDVFCMFYLDKHTCSTSCAYFYLVF
jgi:hypothetical protein